MSDQTPNGPLDGQHGQPGPPAPPVPPKKGLPGWAWTLIVVGGVLFIGIIVTVVVAASLFLNRPESQAQCDSPGAQGCGPVPTVTEGATTEPSIEPNRDFVSIDDLAEFDGGLPIWSLPVLDGWEIGYLDVNGESGMFNNSNGCELLSYQFRNAGASDADSDFPETQRLLEELIRSTVDLYQEAEIVTSLGSTEFALDFAGSERTIEFLTSRVDYLKYVHPDFGQSTWHSREIAARAMPEANSFLMVSLDCLTDLVDAGNSPFEEIRAGLAVLPGD